MFLLFLLQNRANTCSPYVFFGELATDIWTDVAEIQERALAQGLGPFSIPGLILTAVALRNKVPLFSLDRHFVSLARVTGLRLWEKVS